RKLLCPGGDGGLTVGQASWPAAGIAPEVLPPTHLCFSPAAKTAGATYPAARISCEVSFQNPPGLPLPQGSLRLRTGQEAYPTDLRRPPSPDLVPGNNAGARCPRIVGSDHLLHPVRLRLSQIAHFAAIRLYVEQLPCARILRNQLPLTYPDRPIAF